MRRFRSIRIVLLLAVTVALLLPVVASPAESAPVEGDSYGLVDPASGQWHLSQDGQSAVPFYFGNPGDYPFMGDWDCDGVDTPGLYRQSDGYAYLRNSNTQGIAHVSFFFGDPGDIPVAGDFNADGCDTLSIYRPSNQTFYIINMLGTDDGGLGAAEYSFVFGNFGDKPFIGDFNGNGQDTVGLHRESTGLVYYRNTNTQGNADNQFIFGDPGDRLIAGDWNSNGTDSPGLFRPSNTTVYLRYQNSQGNADESHMAGAPGWLPVAGQFGDLTFPPPPNPNVGLDLPSGNLNILEFPAFSSVMICWDEPPENPLDQCAWDDVGNTDKDGTFLTSGYSEVGPGDKITVEVAGVTRSLTVPELTFDSLDSITDTASGMTDLPSDAVLSVFLFENAQDNQADEYPAVIDDVQGTWTADLSGPGVTSESRADVVYFGDDGGLLGLVYQGP